MSASVNRHLEILMKSQWKHLFSKSLKARQAPPETEAAPKVDFFCMSSELSESTAAQSTQISQDARSIAQQDADTRVRAFEVADQLRRLRLRFYSEDSGLAVELSVRDGHGNRAFGMLNQQQADNGN